MGNYIVELARRNINILGISRVWTDTVSVVFEFQWRDPRNNGARWSKTFINISLKEIADDNAFVEAYNKGQEHARDWYVADKVLEAVNKARSVLEGWEDERR